MSQNLLKVIIIEKSKIEKGNLSIEQYKQIVNEIIEAINGKQGLLPEFNDKIFNALLEKIEILDPTHFVFVLKNGIR